MIFATLCSKNNVNELRQLTSSFSSLKRYSKTKLFFNKPQSLQLHTCGRILNSDPTAFHNFAFLGSCKQTMHENCFKLRVKNCCSELWLVEVMIDFMYRLFVPLFSRYSGFWKKTPELWDGLISIQLFYKLFTKTSLFPFL